MTKHVYTNQFFDYIHEGVRPSARALVNSLALQIRASSVVDFGCGRGLWLETWQERGIEDVVGLDGDYVDRARLAIPASLFLPHDLSKPVSLGRKFDIAQSLEVAEHIPPDASEIFIQNLVDHSDCIIFSAAVPGQGGEFHINERPLEYWRGQFEARGYAAYDYLRPMHYSDTSIKPWYRYNTIVYANEAGAAQLSAAVINTRVPEGVAIRDYSSFLWCVRKFVVKSLPVKTVTQIARFRAAVIANRAQRQTA